MYNIRRKTEKFDSDDTADLAKYDEILNNPLCTIVKERQEKLKENVFDNEGRLSSSNERIIMVVTWDEKVLS